MNVIIALYILVLKELCTRVTTNRYCNICNNYGHNTGCGTKCKPMTNETYYITEQIKQYIINQNHMLYEITIDKLLHKISDHLNISFYKCKKLYSTISISNIVKDKSINLSVYFENMKPNIQRCYECNKIIILIDDYHRIWNTNIVCDLCWLNHEDERNSNWDKIYTYTKNTCNICKSVKQSTERYHFDHINMFNKSMMISTMVLNGMSMEDIYKELAKCQLLCLSCHHIITDIERKFGFNLLKSSLTTRMNKNTITQTEYNNELLMLHQLYAEKMYPIYTELQLNIHKYYLSLK